MRSVIPDPADIGGGNEGLDVDGAGAFEPDILQFLVLEQDVIVLSTLVPLHLLIFVDRFSRHRIDITGEDTVLRPAIEIVKAYLAPF